MLSKRLWVSAAVGVALAAAGGGTLWQLNKQSTEHSPAARRSLGLRAERDSSGFRVTWNGRSPAVRASQHGVLRIEDGAFQKDIELDAEQLHAPAFLYAPATDDVTFSLKVMTPNGEPVMESIRLLADVPPPQL